MSTTSQIDEFEEWIRKQISHMTGHPSHGIDLNAHWEDVGIDSLNMMYFLFLLEAMYPKALHLLDKKAEQIKTPEDLCNLIRAAYRRRP